MLEVDRTDSLPFHEETESPATPGERKIKTAADDSLTSAERKRPAEERVSEKQPDRETETKRFKADEAKKL